MNILMASILMTIMGPILIWVPISGRDLLRLGQGDLKT